MRTTITTNFRTNLKKYFDYVQTTGEIVVITRSTGGEMVLLSLEKYNELTGQQKRRG